MKDKEKQINEMAKIIDDNHGFIVSSVETAQSLYNAGYRKIPEDSVVLSREELAQKIYDDIFAILKIKLWLYGDDAMTKNFNGLTKQKILDFTKKWGIKDNHLNEKDYSHIDHLQAHDKQIKEQERKETAEKILNELFDIFDNKVGELLKIKKSNNTEYNDGRLCDCCECIDEIRDFATREGVEIKE